MANEQSKRPGEQQSTGASAGSGSSAMERSGERGLAARQYQDPFSLFDALFERMQRDFFGTSLLNALMPGRGGESEASRFLRTPRMQMHDTGEALELTAEMPGIDGKNINVSLEDGVLTIHGEQHQEEGEERDRTERYASFYRQIALPEGIDTEQPQASYRHGMLTLRFPKTRPRSSARQIPVTTEGAGGTSSSGQSQSGSQSHTSGQSHAKDRAA